MAIGGVDGLASGIQSGAIIDAMIRADRASTAQLEKRSAVFQKRLDALRSFNSKLLLAQVDTAPLRSTSTFLARTATVSTPAALSATVGSTAVPGSYTFNVKDVAVAHKLATAQVGSAATPLGAGTLTLKAGNGVEKTLSFDPSNSSLDGIAKAINDANAGLSAQVVTSGGGAKLMVQAKETGLANAIVKLDGTGDLAALFPGTGGLTEVSAAADARIEIGGPALSITQASNTFKDIVPGLTLTATGKADGVTVTVGTDTKKAEEAVTAFLGSLNGAIEHLTQNASYDKTTKTAGVLFAESGLRRDMDAIVSSMLSRVTGLPQSQATLSSVGIGYDRTSGQFTLDETVLKERLAADPDGVRKLFMSWGSSSHSGVQFSSLTAKTKVDADFTVAITTAARQAQVASTGPLGDTTVIDSTNRNLSLTINGRPVSVVLSEGSYTRADLADHLQKVINGSVTSRGDEVVVGLSGDALDLRTRLYGSNQGITVTGSAGQAALGLSTVAATGVDVVGTINGQAATGQGQVLSGANGTSAEGLRLLITATDPVAAATLQVRKGIAQLVGERLTAQTNVSDGALVTRQDALQSSIDGLKSQITRMDERLEARRVRYQQMFTNMEKMISQYQSQGNFFAGQVKAFENFAASRAGR